MSVGKVMITILIEKGFNITEISRLGHMDRSAVSHVYNGTKGYNGKKFIKRLEYLFSEIGYTKEEYDRIQDSLFHRESKAVSNAHSTIKEITPKDGIQTVKQAIPRVDLPTCQKCNNPVKLYSTYIRGNNAPLELCINCIAIFRQRGLIVETVPFRLN